MNVIQRSCPIFPSPPVMNEGSCHSLSSQVFDTVNVWDVSHSTRYVEMTHCGLYLQFPKTQAAGHLHVSVSFTCTSFVGESDIFADF